MTHVNLNGVPESVRQFVLSVATDPAGVVLELNGRSVAMLLPTSAESNGEAWTDEKNARRCELIERKYAGGLAPSEALELLRLQEEMLRYRQRVAPLPLEDARRLHQELLKIAATNDTTAQP